MTRLTYNAVPYSVNGKIDRRKSDVAIIGCPFDLASTRSAGQREAPAYVRFADQWSPDTMRSIIYGVDPCEELAVVDTGDVEFSDGDTQAGWAAIRDQCRIVYRNVNKAILLIGGDHSVSAMGAAAIAEKEGPLTIFHFDAHPDYWRHPAGMEMDHGTWVRWALDNGAANRVVQFGVRGWGLTSTDQHWASKNDVITYPATQPQMMKMLADELQDTSDPIYLSVDLDVLDPAFAPGVVFQEPGGITSRELLSMIGAVASSGKMVGGDVTELVPSKDPSGITVKMANRCIAQMLTGLARAKS